MLRVAAVLVAVAILGTGISPLPAIAETATEAEMEAVCQNWLSYMVHQKGSWAGETEPAITGVQEVVVDDQLLARSYSIAPSGHIVVPTLKELPPIKAYSEEYDIDVNEIDGFARLLREILQHRAQLFIDEYGSLEATQPVTGPTLLGRRHRALWDIFSEAPAHFGAGLQVGTFEPLREVQPLLETVWHQGAPYNNFCPMGDGGRCVVGCTATAMAQIMNYHEWPPEGLGNYSYYWPGDSSCGGSSPGETLFADFSDPYDWDNMMNSYGGGNTQEERDAVAELCYEVGVAFDMYYGHCGSGTWATDTAMLDYFRYDDTMSWERRQNHTLDSWFDLIKEELNNNRPIWCSYRLTAGGHAIVCDGWRDTGGVYQYHMNYGWGGSYNTWFTVDELYNQVSDPDYERMLLGIAPPPGYACCHDDVCEILRQDHCEGIGGQWLVGFETCDPDPCVVPYACCTGDDTCELMTPEDCAAAGGDLIPGSESCDPNPCIDYACCFNTTCDVMREFDCVMAGGDWMVGIDTCAPNPCLSYACCTGDDCSITRELDCSIAGGDWLSGIDECNPNPCLPYACCVDDLCTIMSQDDCILAGGEWRLGADYCEPNPCISFLVRADGTGDFPTIQEAINAAAFGQTIELANGVFTGDGNRDLDYHGKSIIVRSASGAPDSCIIDCEASEADQHRGFNFHSGETSAAILEGVTIANGYFTVYSGGGIQCRNNSSPTIRNCVIRDCYSEASGGGIYSYDSQPLISYCTIINNEADNGGGILVHNGGQIVIRNCTVSGNSANGHGAGIYSYGCDLIVENCIVSFSTEGEAVYEYYSTVYLSCCDVFGNEGGDWVGCIEDQEGFFGNICEDPMFCDADAGNYSLDPSSSCAPYALPNSECELIGACPVGCDLQDVASDAAMIPRPFLKPGVPNPFGGSTLIAYAIPGSAPSTPVSLSIFDPAGRLVRTLVQGSKPAGEHIVTWDGRNEKDETVAAGVYLCCLRLAGKNLTRQIVIVR